MNAWMTPEAFCWLYAAGCVDAKEHEIDAIDFKFLKDCIERGNKPPDDMIRRVFHRPFEALDDQCVLEEMHAYWREMHLDNMEENTPVFRAVVSLAQRVPSFPEGAWYSVWYVHPKTKCPVERPLVHNVHGYDVKEGTIVYIHGNIIAEVTDEEPKL